MVNVRRKLLAVLTCALLLASASPALAEPPPPPPPPGPSVGAKVLDVVIVRPASLVQTVLGGWMLVIAYPLSLLSGQSESVVDIAVRDPLDYALRRPLGEF